MKTLTYRFAAAPIDMGDLLVLGLAIHEVMPERIVHRPHGLDGYLIALFHSEILIRIHGVEQRYPPGSLVIWEPGECQRYGQTSAPWEYSWVHCDGAFLHEELRRALLPRNAVLTLADPYCLERFLQDVHRELTAYHTPNPILLHNAFVNVLVEIQRQCTLDDLPAQLPAWATEIKLYLERHYAEPHPTAQLAARAHFSVSHFCRQFHQIFGMTVVEYLTEIRMRMAKFLLLDEHLGIAEISRRLGYDSYSHFCALFKRSFGVSPRALRNGMCGEAGRRQHAEARRARELAHWLREGWQLVLEQDFSRDSALDPRLRCYWHGETAPLHAAPHFAGIAQGCLRLQSNPHWTSLRGDDELTEELKVELVAANHRPDGLNLAIAILGDILDGYRLRVLGYDRIALETISNGYWQVLSNVPFTLDSGAADYHLTFWRSDNVFYAEIDGQRVLDYHEPFAPQGPRHRHFAIARFFQFGSADLKHLRVFRRIAPRYVDILEHGRQLLRLGHAQEAYAWFERIAEEQAATPLYHEARYLAALAVPDTQREAKERALRQATADEATPFRLRLLRQWAFALLGWGDVAGAVDVALESARTDPRDDTPRLLVEQIIAALPRIPPAHYAQALRALARLPVSLLRFSAHALTSLLPLQEMPLQRLMCQGMGLTDLSPLRGMALLELDCSANAIDDLSPLAGMPLDTLSCSVNRVRSSFHCAAWRCEG